MTDRIRFLVDGKVVELAGIDPTMTVLNYLRTVARHTGTKEGCAEGDCGACTVVLGVLRQGGLRYLAVNSCLLFLPVLDGKQLITVEDLASPNGQLHPAQRAMVECHASQCGFCTPGFVMSLFALYRSENAPTRQRINDVLAGNLCRCTGYAPIVEAASQMVALGGTDQFADRAPETVAALQAIQRTDTLALSFGHRRYFAPTSLAELGLLRQRHPDAHLLAGGTDVGLLVTKGLRELDTVLYVGDVRELQQCRATPTHIEVGAAATYSEALEAIGRHYPDFAEIIRRLGSLQIRNIGTMVGNIATASPIGDSLPPLIALGASVVLRNGSEARELSLEEFLTGYRKTALRPGEFVTWVRIPIHAPHRHFRAYKISKRFDQDISSVCGAYALELDGDRVADLRVCYGGMAETPRRAVACERLLVGAEWTAEAVEAAAQTLDQEYTPLTDLRASRTYRGLVAKNLLRKFYLETTGAIGATRVIDVAG